MSSRNNNNNRVTAESYGHLLGTEQSGKECWMLRVPPKLAQALEATEEGTVVGELVFRKGGGNAQSKIKPSLEVHVNPDVAAKTENPASMPLQYSLQAMTKKLPTLHPFTRLSNGSIQIHGTVTRTANLQVHPNDAKYRALLKNRILQSTVHNPRFVKPVEANQVVTQTAKRTVGNSAASANSKGFGNAVHQFGKRMLEAQQQSSLQQHTGRIHKKLRRFAPDQPLQSIIFELYAEQPYWTTKDLRVAAGVLHSEAEIKKVLQDICTYHRSGEHKNTWQLKPEYQNSKNVSAGADGGTDGNAAPGNTLDDNDIGSDSA